MAKELSQEEVLDFLCQGGGKVANASLLGHFKRFLRDPQAPAEQQLKRREKFKRYINSVAVVKQEGGVKYVLLRSRYRDLLGEDLCPPEQADQDQQAGNESTKRVDDQFVQTEENEQNRMAPQVGGQRTSHPGVWQVGANGHHQGDTRMQYDTSGYKQRTAVPGTGLCGTWEASVAVNEEKRDSHNYCDTERTYSQSASGLLARSPSDFTHMPPTLTTSPPNLTSLVPSFASKAPSHSHPSPKFTSSPPNNVSSSNNLSTSVSSSDSPGIPCKTHNLTSSIRLSNHNWKHPPGRDSTIRESDPAFVSANCRDLQEQKQCCLSCTELQGPSSQTNYEFPQQEQLAQGQYRHYIQREQHAKIFSPELSAAIPSPMYINPTQTVPSLLFPHDSGITPDVQLECYQQQSHSPSPPLLPGNDLHGMWMCQMPIFKSIRCQLSLQDLDDFVDQESGGSEESDSGEGGDCDTEHRDEDDVSSDSNKEKYQQYIEQKCQNSRRCPPNRKFHSLIEQYNRLQIKQDTVGVPDASSECGVTSDPGIDTSKSVYTAKSFLTNQAPILLELAGSSPNNIINSRLKGNISSSDEELIERNHRKRRRPSRTKKPSNSQLVTLQPDVDRALSVKSNHSDIFIVNNNLADQKHTQAQYLTKAKNSFYIKKHFNHKSSAVPLDSMEHDWIVKLASGSWHQVYGLFTMDPHLALRKDFISGYTALHWFAKHGCTEMFHKFMNGAKKAGIQLDMNIKSSSGYTPLHLAAIHGHHHVATMLVEKLKVDVKVRDNSGKRAWQYLGSTSSGEVWQLLGAPKGKTIFPSRALPTVQNPNIQNASRQLNRKASQAALRKPQHQSWKAQNRPALREIYSG
ncbi:ankyrin repeat domain-containing protein SOWAHB [Rhinophrynus dorsalis]